MSTVQKSISLCFILALWSISNLSFGQIDIAAEIDKDVWEVFKSSYGSKNAEVFNAIHTEDVLRITTGGIRVGQEYRDSNIKSFAIKGGSSRTIDFRFERRIHEEDIAYEVGYYQISIENAGKYYARFSVLLKKIDGRWFIAQDWDTDDINGHKVGEVDWNKLPE